MNDDQIPLIDEAAPAGNDPVRPLTQTQAAALLGVSTRRVQQIQHEADPPPMIQDKFGRALGYPPGLYGKWLRSVWARDAGVTSNGEIYDEKTEKARLLFHQANLAALNEDVKRAELLPADTVVAVGSAMVAAARAQLLGIHSKIRSRFPGTDTADIADAVEELVKEALEELSSNEHTNDLVQRVGAHLRGVEATADADG